MLSGCIVTINQMGCQKKIVQSSMTKNQTVYYLSKIIKASYIKTYKIGSLMGIRLTLRRWKVDWMLDVTFHENVSRIRTCNSPQNMPVLRHLAHNILKTRYF